jgi:hypothetical protein
MMMPTRPERSRKPTSEHEAIFARKSDVEQHQGRQFPLEQLAQRGTAVGATHAEVLTAEIIDQQLTLRRLILDNNDMRAMIHAAESPVPLQIIRQSCRKAAALP